MMLKSKIHRATITDACLHYEGSIGIDAKLLREAHILVGEQVHIWNLNNGKRFETYAISEEENSGKIVINGAAARLAEPGDLIIIATFALYDEAELPTYAPIIVKVDAVNGVTY